MCWKLFNGSKGVADVFNSQYNKIYLADDYRKFLKQQNIVFACIGKHESDKRHNFEKKMMFNENKKTINAYNNLLKTLNAENKQFQQYVFNDFLEEQNLRIKQGKSFDINGCKGVIKQLTYPKIKQKFNVVMDKINEANKPVHDDKLELKIQSYRSSAKDMYPKSRTFTMKIIAVRGMGKTIFLIAFLHSFINRGVVKDEDVYIFWPTKKKHEKKIIQN